MNIFSIDIITEKSNNQAKILSKIYSPKLFVKYLLILIFSSLLLIACINFTVDPLYNWSLSKNIDFKRRDFDERTQKTNYLANINNNYNAILLGNSRSTYIDTTKFNLGVDIYNYSVNAMSVFEYEQVILNFIELTGKEPEKILIGIDPFDFKGDNPNRLKVILKETKSASLKVKNLFSLDIFIFSLKSIIKTIKVNFNSRDRKERYYDNFLRKGSADKNNISNKKYIELNEKVIPYIIDYELFDEYNKLKNKFKNSEFIVYCLPFHKELIESWSKNIDFHSKKENFINNLINIFGKIYYFDYISQHNSSYLNYYDIYHFYPNLGNNIVNKINDLYLNKKTNFGMILDVKHELYKR